MSIVALTTCLGLILSAESMARMCMAALGRNPIRAR
jgi:hypothetical protein